MRAMSGNKVSEKVLRDIEKIKKLEQVGVLRMLVFLGEGPKLTSDFDAIMSLHNHLQIRTKFFGGHERGTNSHAGRSVVGELVGKTIKRIGGRLSNIAVAYIRPEYRSKRFDVASIEAQVAFPLLQQERGVFDSLFSRVREISPQMGLSRKKERAIASCKHQQFLLRAPREKRCCNISEGDLWGS